MADSFENNAQYPASPSLIPSGGANPVPVSRQQETQNRVAEISNLLSALDEAATESGVSIPNARALAAIQNESRMLEARLLMASSLLTALRHKHGPTATHSLSVALGCSCWAALAEIDEETRNTVELAALMHDIGKIGVPDRILEKTGRLTTAEKQIMDRHRQHAVDILKSCCGSERVLNAVRYAGTHFNDQDSQLTGKHLPLEARMIAIVDAFDAMTTDHVYRPARSREQALGELFEFAGTQFDPQLVQQFANTLSEQQDTLTAEIRSRWLGDLTSRGAGLPWANPGELAANPGGSFAGNVASLFEQKLIAAMQDGVVFVDGHAQITFWSKGAERLTGIRGSQAIGQCFTPSLLQMLDCTNQPVTDEDCPVAESLGNNTQLQQRRQIIGSHGEHAAVDLHIIPVQTQQGTVLGATILLHDAQEEASLEEKCAALHAEVTKDPMTKVANRAEFDRMLALYVEAHQQAAQPLSLIMVDIDHFKRINDNYGHQAGDKAIITLAKLLTSMCRPGDLVARYGGEEFAVLCADCGNADSAQRAEQIREKLAGMPHAYLANKCITASFGVTELEAGDTPESFLRRSDQALLLSKENGRDQVTQFGLGVEKGQPPRKWWQWRRRKRSPHAVESTLTSPVPIDVAIEKLRGFVSEHDVKIVSISDNKLEMEVSNATLNNHRRQSDRHMLFRVTLQFSEIRMEGINKAGISTGEYVRTRINLKILPKRPRRRRRADMTEHARLIHQRIKAYLMADKEEAQAEFEPTVGT